MISPNIHIIYAEDNDDDAFIFKHIIRDIPSIASFVRLCNGQELIDYLSSKAPDILAENKINPYIVFIDLNMPGMCGFKVLEKIKDSLHTLSHHIKIVILSSSSRIEDIEKSMQLGASDYLVKLPSYDKMAKSLKYVFNELLAQRFGGRPPL